MASLIDDETIEGGVAQRRLVIQNISSGDVTLSRESHQCNSFPTDDTSPRRSQFDSKTSDVNNSTRDIEYNGTHSSELDQALECGEPTLSFYEKDVNNSTREFEYNGTNSSCERFSDLKSCVPTLSCHGKHVNESTKESEFNTISEYHGQHTNDSIQDLEYNGTHSRECFPDLNHNVLSLSSHGKHVNICSDGTQDLDTPYALYSLTRGILKDDAPQFTLNENNLPSNNTHKQTRFKENHLENKASASDDSMLYQQRLGHLSPSENRAQTSDSFEETHSTNRIKTKLTDVTMFNRQQYIAGSPKNLGMDDLEENRSTSNWGIQVIGPSLNHDNPSQDQGQKYSIKNRARYKQSRYNDREDLKRRTDIDFSILPSSINSEESDINKYNCPDQGVRHDEPFRLAHRERCDSNPFNIGSSSSYDRRDSLLEEIHERQKDIISYTDPNRINTDLSKTLKRTKPIESHSAPFDVKQTSNPFSASQNTCHRTSQKTNIGQHLSIQQLNFSELFVPNSINQERPSNQDTVFPLVRQTSNANNCGGLLTDNYDTETSLGYPIQFKERATICTPLSLTPRTSGNVFNTSERQSQNNAIDQDQDTDDDTQNILEMIEKRRHKQRDSYNSIGAETQTSSIDRQQYKNNDGHNTDENSQHMLEMIEERSQNQMNAYSLTRPEAQTAFIEGRQHDNCDDTNSGYNTDENTQNMLEMLESSTHERRQNQVDVYDSIGVATQTASIERRHMNSIQRVHREYLRFSTDSNVCSSHLTSSSFPAGNFATPSRYRQNNDDGSVAEAFKWDECLSKHPFKCFKMLRQTIGVGDFLLCITLVVIVLIIRFGNSPKND